MIFADLRMKYFIVETKARRKTFKEVIHVINKSKRVIKTITFMLGENSRADDDEQDRKRYKSPPPPPVTTADDEDDDIEDEVLEGEKKEACTEEQEMKVPKLIHSVSSFFLVKNQTNGVQDCPPSPKKTKSNTPLEENIIKTEAEIKHLGRTIMLDIIRQLCFIHLISRRDITGGGAGAV